MSSEVSEESPGDDIQIVDDKEPGHWLQHLSSDL